MRRSIVAVLMISPMAACSDASQATQAKGTAGTVVAPPPTGGSSAGCMRPTGCGAGNGGAGTAGSGSVPSAGEAGSGGSGDGGAAGAVMLAGAGGTVAGAEGSAAGGGGEAGAPTTDPCADVCARIGCGMDAACGVDCGACEEVVLDFDDLMDNEVVTEQYAEWLHVSSLPGFELRTNNAANLLGGSEPNILSGYVEGGGASNVNTDFIFDFVHPVSALRLLAVGINTAPGEKCATLEIEDELAGSVRRDFSTRPDDPPGYQSTQAQIDLSEFTRVTHFAIVEMNDPAGFGMNDLTFTVHAGP